MGIFLRLSKYVMHQWPLFFVAVILTFISNFLSLLGPRYSGAAIDAIELESGVDFTAVWENVWINTLAISLLVWTSILSLFLTLNALLPIPPTNLWMLFLIGIQK